MNWQSRTGALKHLGALHGKGSIFADGGAKNIGSVTYQIDGYNRGSQRSDNGELVGAAKTLMRAFRAGQVCIALADGQFVDIVLSDPRGSSTAEITVSGRFPRYNGAS
jgi:hypothetical protein